MKIEKLAMFLVLSVLASASVASCGSDKKEDLDIGETTQNMSSAETIVDFSSMSLLEQMQYANKQVPDDLPERDFGGKTIILGDMDLPSESTGAVLDDAAYRQYLAVEERFNCELSAFRLPSDWDEHITQLNALLLSGDDFASIIRVRNTAAGSIVSQNYLHELSDFQYIDVEKPWYFKEQIDMYAYKDQRYFCQGI